MAKSFASLIFQNHFRFEAHHENIQPAARNFAKRKAWFFAIGMAFVSLQLPVSTAHAQSSVLQKGDGVITGFSGVAVPDTAFPPGVNPLDKILIDPEGASAQILRLAPQAPLQGQVLTPSVFKIKAKDVGQVFGVALDDAPVKNIYLGATSAYGLQIVTPDTDGDGKPERSRLGRPDATWMPGQFGNGGEPGSIYKVDGQTGAVSLFATLPGNSGPGIGQIVFDKTSRQFFASDLDTGLIHRIDISGKLRDSFDYGVAGRSAATLPPVPDDGITMNIKSPAFNSEDPATWGYTPKARRVWGMAINDGRLYYAVAEGPQVWSVGINSNGSFGSDPRIEINASTLDSPNAITAIAFDDNGMMYLAQRGDQRGSYDYSVFADSKDSVVARYRRDPASPADWAKAPEFYAIGSEPDYRNASGGVDIGLGVGPDGRPSGLCSMLWSTGDALKRLGAGPDAGIIQGLQANDIGAVRPADTPPTQTNFVDYDQMFADPTALGHIGSVVVWRDCDGAPAVTAQAVPTATSESLGSDRSGGQYPGGYQDKPTPASSPDSTPRLFFSKKADGCMVAASPADSYVCYYFITITNVGTGTFNDHIVVEDTPLIAGATVAEISGLCPAAAPAPKFTCDIVKTLAPGASIQMKAAVRVTIPTTPNMSCDVPNQATLIKPNALTASDSAHLPPSVKCNGNTPQPNIPDINVDKDLDGPCTGAGTGPYVCHFKIKVINNGKSNFGVKTVKFTDISIVGNSDVIVGAPFNTCIGVGNAITCQDSVFIPPGKALEATSTVIINTVLPGSSCDVPNMVVLADPHPGQSSTAVAHLPPSSGCVVNPKTCPPGTSGVPVPGACSPIVNKQGPYLEIEKSFEPPCTLAGAFVTCDWHVTIINNGTGDTGGKTYGFTDKLTVFDSSVVITKPGAPWTCKDETFAPGAFSCSATKNIASAGGIQDAHMKIAIPVAIIKSKYNCKVINIADLDTTKKSSWHIVGIKTVPGSGCDSNVGNNDLQIHKTAYPCVVAAKGGGYDCNFRVELSNAGPGDFPGGQAFVTDEVNGAFAIKAVNETYLGSTIACPAGVGHTGCAIALSPLKKGAPFFFYIKATLTFADIAKGICSVTNTATLTAPLGGSTYNIYGNTDRDVATAAIPDPQPSSCVKLLQADQQQYQIQQKKTYDHIERKKDNGPSCSPGFSFHSEDRKCAPRIITVETTPPPPPPVVQGCSPGFRLDRELRCAPIGVTPPSGSVTPPPIPREPPVNVQQPPAPRGPPPHCPSGSTGTPPNCRPIPCPEGTRGQQPNCVPIIRTPPREPAKCPEGQTGKPPNCQPIFKRRQ